MAIANVLERQKKELNINNGLDREKRVKLADDLNQALANTYVLYLKTQNFHWNVVGPNFYGLHKLTEAQYQDMAEAIDDIAERIRAIGFPALGSFKQYYELSQIPEELGVPKTEDMISQLVDANEICSRILRNAVSEAETLNDVKTADLLTDRIGQHEENAWMLRALLQ